jgi:phage major head subunit gpT-like protein
MPANLVSVANALTPGIDTRFISTYARNTEGIRPDLARMMDLAVPSDGAWNVYHHYKSAPHVRRWDRGQAIHTKGFADVGWTTSNLDWGEGVEAHSNDLADDRTQNLVNRAGDVGKSYALLPERVFFQMITGRTDPLLLPTIPNAPDGVAIYSATDGDGNARYSVSGGNVIASGSGVADPQSIRDDFFSGQTRQRQFLDTESTYPLFGDDFTKAGFVIAYNVANDQVFREAFKQDKSLVIVKNVAGTENVAGVTPDNIVIASGIPIFLRPTVFITDNDWYMFAVSSDVKPVYQQYRQAPEMHVQTRDNSDIGRRNKVLGWFWDGREGYGTNECYGTVKINN